MDKQIIIIGGGPAGISASLYTARAGIKTIVIAKDGGVLEKTDKIENYYGFADPITGEFLLNNGWDQAKRLGVEMVQDEVVGLGYEETLTVMTKNDKYSAPCVIIATGSSRAKPKILGLLEYEGKGVSYCAVCDAFFYRGKDVAVLGEGEYALHEAMDLAPVVNSVTILTNAKEPTVEIPSNIKVDKRAVSAFLGDGNVITGVEFSEGETISVNGIFIAVGIAGSADLAKKLGAMTDGKSILIDENMATNIPGLFAAGDCTGGMLQIAKAVYEGAKAGTEAIKYIRSL